MDFERLIELAGRKRPLPWRRVTYAHVIADCPISMADMVDTLTRNRSPDAKAENVRTELRRLICAMPRAGVHRGRSAWRVPPKDTWRDALSCERRARMAQMTQTQTADAVLGILASGLNDFWLRHRLGWAFTQGGIVSRWIYHDLDGDPDEITAGLFRLDALYLTRLAAPEMTEIELVELVLHIQDDSGDDFKPWREENLMNVLDQQLPNAGVSDMMQTTHQTAGAREIVREALSRTQPDPNILVYHD